MKSFIKASGVIVLFAFLAACQTTTTPLVRFLPEWPAHCQPVRVKDPKTGEEMLVIAARERAGRVKANRIIASCAEWYEDVKASYEGT